jgi:4-diphosphocytidyl-2-C-methyl-D-erythritol kinase
MRLQAPAKINLHLRVGPPRTDGFHPLLSWMTTVSLFDTLTFRSTNTVGITLRCDDPTLPTDERNLVVKAARLLLSALSHERRQEVGGLEIDLLKRIPSGAGLGGGSSDAATTLLALNKLWQLNWTASQLGNLAAQLGSDVPFFLHGPSSVCTSRGDVVAPIAIPAAKWALLVLPAMHVSTPAVYKRFDELHLRVAGLRRAQSSRELARRSPSEDTRRESSPATRGETIREEEVLEWDDQPPWHQWAQLSARLLLPRLINDLEAPAFSWVPELGELRQRVESIVDRPVRMSGSGSSLFTLFDTRDEAEAAAHDVNVKCNIKTHAAELAPQIMEDPTKV